MSRRKTKPEEIIDREHYFNRYLAKEALHEHIEQNKYESMNSSLEQILEKDNNSNVRRKILLHATNGNGEEFEEYLSRQSCENWLECISDVQLHSALKQLTKNSRPYYTIAIIISFLSVKLQKYYIVPSNLCPSKNTVRKER